MRWTIIALVLSGNNYGTAPGYTSSEGQVMPAAANTQAACATTFSSLVFTDPTAAADGSICLPKCLNSSNNGKITRIINEGDFKITVFTLIGESMWIGGNASPTLNGSQIITPRKTANGKLTGYAEFICDPNGRWITNPP